MNSLLRRPWFKYIFMSILTQTAIFTPWPAWAQPISEALEGRAFNWRADGWKLAVVAVLLYLIIRLIVAKKRQAPPPFQPSRQNDELPRPSVLNNTPSASERVDESRQPASDLSTRQQRARAAWGSLMAQPAQNQPGQSEALAVSQLPAHETEEKEFIQGAKTLYGRIYEDADTGDFQDMENFLLPALTEAIRQAAQQRRQKGINGKFELLFVQANLLNLAELEGKIQFTTRLRLPGHTGPQEVKETWSFARKDAQATWIVEALAQSPLLQDEV